MGTDQENVGPAAMYELGRQMGALYLGLIAWGVMPDDALGVMEGLMRDALGRASEAAIQDAREAAKAGKAATSAPATPVVFFAPREGEPD